MRNDLQTLVENEMVRALARRLDYSPATTDLSGSASVMVDDLMTAGYTDADTERVREGFRRWGPTATRWPRCADILPHIPRLSELPRPALPEPTITVDQARANVAKIQRMLRK